MRTEIPKFKAWIAAERKAQAAERELHVALRRSLFNSSVPSQELHSAALESRSAAQQLFPEAMQEIKDVAESLRSERVLPDRQLGVISVFVQFVSVARTGANPRLLASSRAP